MELKTENERIKLVRKQVEEMSHIDMARIYRFSPCDGSCIWFVSGTFEEELFMQKWKALGGMTPEISKRIGR